MIRLDHAWNSLVTMTFQSAALCLMAGIGLLLLRKSAAATRHLILILSMSALLTVPFLALFLPHWQVPLTHTPAALSPAVERTVAPAQAPIPAAESDTHLSSSQVTSVPTVSAPTRLPLPLPSLAHRSLQPGPMIPFSAGSASELRPARIPVWQTARFQQCILAIWLLGVALALLRLLAGLIGTRRVTMRETVSDPLLSQTVAQIQRELGLERAVTVRKTLGKPGLPVPLTWGLFRPTLLLPPTFLEWPQERQRMVVLHELAHIQRADWLIQVLGQITCALYWFHPLVWWTTHRLQAESERACDDTVLLTGVAPLAYAETLLEVIRTMNRSKTSFAFLASMLSMAHPPIEARLQAILSPQRRQRPSRSITYLASLGAAVCAIALASVQVKAGQTPASSVRPSNVPTVTLGGAAPAPAGVSPEGSNAVGLRLASGQSNTTKPAPKSQKNSSANETAMLRKKLDALEQLLVQNQQENARLRQQVKALEAQQHRNADASKKMAAASADQLAAAQTMLRDLEQQKALLRDRAAQADALYRNGQSTYQDALKLKGEQDVNRARIEAAQEQLKAIAANKMSEKEQAVLQTRQEIAIKQAELAAEQESLKIVQERFKAGLTSGSELSDEEVKVSRLQTEIDRLKLELAQKGGR